MSAQVIEGNLAFSKWAQGKCLYSCFICSDTFKNRNLFQAHLKKDHGIVKEMNDAFYESLLSQKEYTACKFCGENILHDESRLREHIELYHEYSMEQYFNQFVQQNAIQQQQVKTESFNKSPHNNSSEDDGEENEQDSEPFYNDSMGNSEAESPKKFHLQENLHFHFRENGNAEQVLGSNISASTLHLKDEFSPSSKENFDPVSNSIFEALDPEDQANNYAEPYCSDQDFSDPIKLREDSQDDIPMFPKMENGIGESENLDENQSMQDKHHQFTCHECGFKYLKQAYLDSHIKKVHQQLNKKNTLKCNTCCKLFFTVKNLNRHLRKIHNINPKPHICHICCCDFESKEELLSHCNGVHDGKRYKCNQCNLCFKSFQGRWRHALTVHEGLKPKKNHACQHCPAKFTDSFKLRQHISMIHVGYKYRCDYCEKTVSTLRGLQKHVEIIHKENLFHCNQCEKKFTTQRNLRQHQRSVHEENPYQCQNCGLQFVHEESLQKHIKNHHQNKSYQCPYCERKLSNKYNVQQHVKTVHIRPPNQCPHCSKQFSITAKLKSHIKEYHKDKMNQCNQCPAWFIQPQHLRYHTVCVHDRVRHFCEQCEADFSTLSNLKRHRKTEHLRILYTCDQCGFKSKHASGIRRHNKSVHKSTSKNKSELPPISNDLQEGANIFSECKIELED